MRGYVWLLVKILKKIELIKIPEFPITGKYLLEQGLKSGRKMGEILKKIEQKWIENDFNLGDEELKNLIKKYTWAKYILLLKLQNFSLQKVYLQSLNL